MNGLSGYSMRVPACGIGLAAVLASPLGADEAVLTPVRDNTLFSDAGGAVSSGAGSCLFSGLSGGQVGDPIQHRALLAFDLTGIPPGSEILDVSLTLSLIQAGPFGGPDTMSLHRVTEDWGEGASDACSGGGAPAEAGDATWLHTFFSTDLWGSAGGDFNPTISSSQTVGQTLGEYVWGKTPEMLTDISAWVDDPSTNYGWVLIGNEVDLFHAKKFGSRESAAELQPALYVEYQPGCPWDCDGSGDGNANVSDLLTLLGQYDVAAPANCTGGSCDYDNNGCVDVIDLLKLLGHYTTDPGGIGCPL